MHKSNLPTSPVFFMLLYMGIRMSKVVMMILQHTTEEPQKHIFSLRGTPATLSTSCMVRFGTTFRTFHITKK